MTIRLYFNEDSMQHALVNRLIEQTHNQTKQSGL